MELSALIDDIYKYHDTNKVDNILIENPKRLYVSGDTIVSRQMITGPSELFNEEHGKWIAFELGVLYTKYRGSPDDRQIGEIYVSVSDYREARRAAFFDEDAAFDKDFKTLSLPAQRSREQDIADRAALSIRSFFDDRVNVVTKR